MAKKFPSWSELTASEKQRVNNGCGPSWLTDKVKDFIELYLFGWMFNAQCGHHDWGYLVGGSELRRLECDLKFGLAVIKDALRALVNALCAVFIAPVFFILVLLFGWLSFNYGEPLTKGQALARNRRHG